MKKRVLITLLEPFERGGAQTVIMNIVETLSEQFIFDLLLFNDGNGSLEEKFCSYGGKIFKYPVCSHNSTFSKRLNFYVRPLKMIQIVSMVIKENGPYDAVHAHNALESGLCLYAAYQRGVPERIGHAHTIFGTKGGNILRKYYNCIYRKMLRKYATAMVGCSAAANDSIFGDGYGQIIYNGVNLERFDPHLFSNTSEHPLTLIQVATFSDNKNQCFSVNIINALIKKGLDTRLYFVGRNAGGEASYYNGLLSLISELELTRYVSFFPSDANIPELMSGCDLLLFPSKREGFGIVPIEAQSMGLRCYASDSVPKDIDCGGVMFLPLSLGPEKWAEIIMKDYEQTKGGRDRFDCSRFDSKTIAKRYAEIYEGKK